jgi:hypothetical protein
MSAVWSLSAEGAPPPSRGATSTPVSLDTQCRKPVWVSLREGHEFNYVRIVRTDWHAGIEDVFVPLGERDLL